ncbi:MAG: hypothetical protein ABIP75_09635 [Pyrinomonadaceae bacterium]
MAICRVCGADAPPEKAWCPQCNQPLEPEAKRRIDREIDTFAGTLAGQPRPVLKLDPPVAPPPVKIAALPALPVPAVKVTPAGKAEDPAAKPPRPSVSTKAAEAKETSVWVYLVVGGLIGFFLLLVAGAVGLWLYLK